MTVARWGFGSLLVGAILACSSSPEVSSPPSIDLSRAVTKAVSPSTIFGQVGSDSKDLPAVRIATTPDDQPLPGVTVIFTVSGNQSSSFTATTGNDGIARMSSLKLDSTPGQYNIFARAGALPSVKFTALALAQAPVAVYDLQTEGGLPLPVTYAAPAGHFFTTTGGHYVLLPDGSYIYGTETDSEPRLQLPQRFIRRDAQNVDFYAVLSAAPPPGGFPDPGYLFSTGKVIGSTLAVTYEDFIDFPDEVYVLRQ